MRKVEIEIKIKLSLRVYDGVEIEEIVNELDYDFYDTTGDADVLNTELLEFNVIDSK